MPGADAHERDDIAGLVEEVAELKSRGIHGLKLKVGGRTPREDAERVVVLAEELAGVVAAARERPLRLEQLPRPGDDALHRLVPRPLAQAAARGLMAAA